MSTNTDNFNTAPCKLFAEDLKVSKKLSAGSWELEINTINHASRTVLTYDGLVWLQGDIDQTAGSNNEILIVRDGTGKVKVTNCSSVPGDLSWIKQGAYCSIIGCLVKESALPIVSAVKLTNLSGNPILRKMWPSEVEELKLLLTKQVSPALNTLNTVRSVT